MKKVLGALAALALCSTMTFASIPDASKCTVIPADNLNGLVFTPTVTSTQPSVNTITVRNELDQVIANSPVVVQVGSNTVLCGSTVLTGVTNASGQVVITLGGGGCAHNDALSGIVRAGGFTIREYSNVKSPDYNGAVGGGGDLGVRPDDFQRFSQEFLDNEPNECHDYDNNANTGIEDIIIFGPQLTSAASCLP